MPPSAQSRLAAEAKSLFCVPDVLIIWVYVID